MDMITSLYAAAKRCLDCSDPLEKVLLTNYYSRQWRDGLLDLQYQGRALPLPEPGRPELPKLVPPNKVARRKINSDQGRQALVHAICHIEFNAINLAWDAIYRFRDMPQDYYSDWLQVAEEEAYHFSLLRERLQQMDSDYGAYDAHNGLWEMACKTDHDVLVRMALVPRVLEARGLDVTPGMIQRLRSAGDLRTVALLEIILRDEIGHVAIGTRWFQYVCGQRSLDAELTFTALLQEYMQGHVKGPFHEQARREAGFSEEELDSLKQQAGMYD
jgi:uncharacterized ferritin-like protein (DUF455 family)